MRHDHRKPARRRWADAHIFSSDERGTVHSQREYVGYGFTSYYFVGTIEQILAAQAGCKRSYPVSGYGGTYSEPEDLGDGLFYATGWHSESCE